MLVNDSIFGIVRKLFCWESEVKMSNYIKDNSLPKIAIAIFTSAFFIIFVIIPFASDISDILIPIGIGIPFVIISFIRWKQFDISKQWKQTMGKVIYTKIGIDNPHTQAVYNSNGDDLARLYFPHIKYSYEVEGKKYISENVAFYRELKTRKKAIKLFIQDLVEPTLIVYYNPKCRNESTLIAKFPLHRRIFWYFIMSIGLTSIIIGLIIATK